MKAAASIALSALLLLSNVSSIYLGNAGAGQGAAQGGAQGAAPQQAVLPGASSAPFPRNEDVKPKAKVSRKQYVVYSQADAARPDLNPKASVAGYVSSNPLGVTFNPNPSGQRLPANSPFDWFKGVFNHETDFEANPNVQAPAQYVPSQAQLSGEESANNIAAIKAKAEREVAAEAAQAAAAAAAQAAAAQAAAAQAAAAQAAAAQGAAGQGAASQGAAGQGAAGQGSFGGQGAAGQGALGGFGYIDSNGRAPSDLIAGNPYASNFANVPNSPVIYSAPSQIAGINPKYYNNFPYNLNNVSGFLSAHLPIRPYSNNWYGQDWAPYPGEWIDAAQGLGPRASPAENAAKHAAAYGASAGQGAAPAGGAAGPSNAGWVQINLPKDGSAAPAGNAGVINVGSAQ